MQTSSLLGSLHRESTRCPSCPALARSLACAVDPPDLGIQHVLHYCVVVAQLVVKLRFRVQIVRVLTQIGVRVIVVADSASVRVSFCVFYIIVEADIDLSSVSA